MSRIPASDFHEGRAVVYRSHHERQPSGTGESPNELRFLTGHREGDHRTAGARSGEFASFSRGGSRFEKRFEPRVRDPYLAEQFLISLKELCNPRAVPTPDGLDSFVRHATELFEEFRSARSRETRSDRPHRVGRRPGDPTVGDDPYPAGVVHATNFPPVVGSPNRPDRLSGSPVDRHKPAGDDGARISGATDALSPALDLEAQLGELGAVDPPDAEERTAARPATKAAEEPRPAAFGMREIARTSTGGRSFHAISREARK